MIFKVSIQINGDDSNHQHLNADTTVQEKNITFPSDAKLHKKIINKELKIVLNEQPPTPQRYTKTLKKSALNNALATILKKIQSQKKVKTIAGRLVGELERNLSSDSIHQKAILFFKQVLAQNRNSKNKIYSLHEPNTVCISKGKEHKKYEFGNKVSIVKTQNTGVIVGAMGFRSEFDVHTLTSAL